MKSGPNKNGRGIVISEHESIPCASRISLTQGQSAVVDNSDLAIVGHHRWYAHRRKNTFYPTAEINKKTVYMHHLIAGKWHDHIDGNGLNNRRSNLRPATVAQNSRNTVRVRSPSNSGYRGVSASRTAGKWIAAVRVMYKSIYLGTFDDLELAAFVASEARIKYHGEFAPDCRRLQAQQ